MMDLYVMLHGQNPQRAEVLSLINLNESNVERFRDCGLDREKLVIWVFARTGSTNAFDKSNNRLGSNDFFIGKKDDAFDSTYEWLFFNIPPFKDTSKIKHYGIPNLKKVIEGGIKDLEAGKPNPAVMNLVQSINKTVSKADKDGTVVIDLTNEN